MCSHIRNALAESIDNTVDQLLALAHEAENSGIFDCLCSLSRFHRLNFVNVVSSEMSDTVLKSMRLLLALAGGISGNTVVSEDDGFISGQSKVSISVEQS